MKKDAIEIQNIFTNVSIFGQYAWMLNLYRYDKITSDHFLKFNKEIDLFKIELDEIFNELIIINKNSPFDWDDWEVEEVKTGKAYYSQDAQDWLLFGFVFTAINKKTISFISQETFDRKADWLFTEVNNFIEIIRNDARLKWVKILPQLPIEELVERIDWLKSSFDLLNENYVKQRDLIVVKRTLSEKSIQTFKELNYESWLWKPPIYKLFETYKNLEIVESKNINLPKIIGCNIFLINGKHLFLEEDIDYLSSFSEYGNELRENETLFFLGKFPSSIESHQYENADLAIDSLIEKLVIKNYNPNLIIMNRSLTYYRKDFQTNSKFKSSFLETDKNKRLLTDSYDNIPIFYFEKNWFKGKIVVCQFDIAMKMKQKRTEEYYKNVLDIQVDEVNEEDIKSKLESEPQNWLLDDHGNKISVEEAKIKLRKSIKLYVGSEIDFEVLDENAFEICKIKSIGT